MFKLKNKNGQKGTYHVLMSIMLVPLIGAIALALDGFQIMTANIQQDSNAEYAAIAAIKEFHTNPGNFVERTSAAARKAGAVAGSNFYIGTHHANQMPGNNFEGNDRFGELKFGVMDSSRTFYECTTEGEYLSLKSMYPYDAVKVILKLNNDSNIKATFASVLNIASFNSSNETMSFFDESTNTISIAR